MAEQPQNPAWGFGIAAGPDLHLAAQIAAAAESLGYGSVWTNDTPGGDGLANAGAMLGATSVVQAGVGAVPGDRWSPRDLASRISSLALPLDRFVLVVGAGRATPALRVVEQTVAGLRDLLGSRLQVGVAALGPKMCRLSGRIADVVLLNWSTPERISWSRNLILEGSRKRDSTFRHSSPTVAAYVRMALGDRAGEILSEEASRYARAPHYARHFDAMGAAPGAAARRPRDAGALLEPYRRVLDETIVRAVAYPPDLEHVLEIVRAAAPQRPEPAN